MNRCSPVEMRKNLVMVETFKKEGIDFVAIPASERMTKEALLSLCDRQLESLVDEIEGKS